MNVLTYPEATGVNRLTTPVVSYTIPEELNPSDFTWLLWTFKQRNKIVVEKELGDVQINGQVIYCTLTQEETKRFVSGTPLYVQLRCGIGSAAYRSEIDQIEVGAVLNDEIMPR